MSYWEVVAGAGEFGQIDCDGCALCAVDPAGGGAGHAVCDCAGCGGAGQAVCESAGACCGGGAACWEAGPMLIRFAGAAPF